MRDFQAPGRSAVFATEGMCATSHPLAAKVALDLLQQGGNAVDAAIGAGVLLGLCEPQMTGLGGDCFMLLKPAGSERIVTVNGSGRAPVGADAGALRARGLDAVPVYGVESVTLPGAVDAFCQVSADWGRLGLADTLAPAIRYAEIGVPVAPRVAYDWAEPTHLQGAARRHYLNGSVPLRSGQIFRAPSQAEVLRRIAREGRAGFYEGEVAQDLIDSLREMGGCHTLDDLAATTCTYGDPIRSAYRNLDLFEHAPNGTGAVASLILNILQHFDMASLDPLGPERAHLEAEATKLAYDARNRFIADPDHTTRLAHLLAPETAAQLASLIDPTRVLPDVAPLTEAIHRDTVYITVVDRDRMAVSLIYSIFHSFGSGLASDKFGILFQNRGAGFTLTKGHPNEMAGGKRPMHTIIPAMLGENGRITMPFGVMGGAYQPVGHARLVTNLRDHGMELQSAIDAPRAFVENGTLALETGYPTATAQALTDLGHQVILSPGPRGGAQAIRIHADGVLEGASDPRKDGCALGC
ncbi:gamma-glutamyltransferase family protein [Roseinatronobacter sp.]|uniref:gamma-glutamyltransferase family protein n=1 Tax=Roseinatronobacter sp. TaxID=1945755 RepID=UPI0025F33130|nr:gamma-glutamyltransferase family protein [Roseibaca sp.]